MRFNPKLAALAFATTAAIASFGAQASSIDVKVTGTITPGACTPTLAGGGTVDYGTIGAAEVNFTKFTPLAEKTVAFSIACNAPSRVGIRVADNQSSSVVPGAVAVVENGATDVFAFGLGSSAGKSVGSYVMRVKPGFTIDSQAATLVWSTDNGITWNTPSGNTGMMQGRSSLISSWGRNNAPVPFTNLSGTLGIQAALNKGSELNLTNDVPLDGSATIELVYM